MQILFPHWEIVRFLTKSVPWPYPPERSPRLLSRCGAACHRARRRVALEPAPEKPAWPLIGSIALLKGTKSIVASGWDCGGKARDLCGGSPGAETREASGVILPSSGSLSAQAEAQTASSPPTASWRRTSILLDRDRFGQLQYSSPTRISGSGCFCRWSRNNQNAYNLETRKL